MCFGLFLKDLLRITSKILCHPLNWKELICETLRGEKISDWLLCRLER